MLGIAVLGCGRIGRMHAANIAALPDARLAGIFDIDADLMAGTAAVHGTRTFPDAGQVFADPGVDAVLIATATPTHADLIERAVEAGKAVLCEKPIDLSLTRVRQCRERISGSGVPVQIGFNRRFDPGHLSARDAARAGEIGDLHQVIITSRDPGMPPRGYYEVAGGLFRDMVIHDFDLARFLLDEEPVDVFAVGGRLIDPAMMDELGDFDTSMVVMRTASGKMCHINTSRASTYGYDQRAELLGTGGMIVSDNRKPHEVRRFGAKVVESAAPYLEFFVERYREAFDAELGAFVRAVEAGIEPSPSFADGEAALVLAEAAMLSAQEGRMVKVDEVRNA